MKPIVLKTNKLTKAYSDTKAVESFDMNIRKGDIYGLIGRNGAGKTTLIRMITSLSIQDSGEIELFGQDSVKGLLAGRKRIGCVIENPAFYKKLTAEQNLEYYRRFKGIPDKNCVKETLELVGLTNTGKKKFKDFSLGMKQRLGLALALLDHPDFIILDEPVNGLDPIGIVEFRNTIKKLNEEHGITMIISSHILSELALIATRYGIIEEGKLIKELSQKELQDISKTGLAIIVDDTAKASGVIETKLNSREYKVLSNNEIRLYDYLDKPSEVLEHLSREGVSVSSFNEVGDNLEDYFVSLVGEVM